MLYSQIIYPRGDRTRREEGSPRHVIAVACPMVPTFRVRRPLCAKLRNKGEIRRGPGITHPLKGRRKLQNAVMAGVHEAPYRRQFLRAGRRKRKISRNYSTKIIRRSILHASSATHECLIVFTPNWLARLHAWQVFKKITEVFRLHK